MEFKLIEITGLAQAITTLKISRRHYDVGEHARIMDYVYRVTNPAGFIMHAATEASASIPSVKAFNYTRDEVLKELNKVAKYGAGVGQEAWKDDGHDTLLKYITFTFTTVGLHRGAQDDLDAHAKRFNSRIVRESTRGKGAYGDGELKSDWYKDTTRSVADMYRTIQGEEPPAQYTDQDGVSWTFTSNGYVRSDLIGSEDQGDYERGNYPMSFPSTAIWQIDLYELRHVYMRRNKFTHASPELRQGIESLADQIEEAIPCDLGKLVRYDYALVPEILRRNGEGEIVIPANPEACKYSLVHVMDIKKVFVPRSSRHEP